MTVLVQERAGEIRPEWLRQPPAEWETRLREISPIVDRVSHLRFRWRADDDVWALYECTPAHLLDPIRAEQLTVHWTTLPKDRQYGRRSVCTEYQHYMMREHRVAVGLFWVLQGTADIVGGTPAQFTDRERAILEAEHEEVEAIPPGTLPPIPFDERVVAAVQARDRLIKYSGDLDELKKADCPDALRAEDDENAKAHRAAFLAWHRNANAPCSEFLKWYHRKAESKDTFRPAPEGLTDQLAVWRDQFIEFGTVPGARTSSAKRSHVTVQ